MRCVAIDVYPTNVMQVQCNRPGSFGVFSSWRQFPNYCCTFTLSQQGHLSLFAICRHSSDVSTQLPPPRHLLNSADTATATAAAATARLSTNIPWRCGPRRGIGRHREKKPHHHPSRSLRRRKRVASEICSCSGWDARGSGEASAP